MTYVDISDRAWNETSKLIADHFVMVTDLNFVHMQSERSKRSHAAQREADMLTPFKGGHPRSEGLWSHLRDA